MKALFGKMPKVPQSQPPPTRDDAFAEADKKTELARRRGGAADIVGSPYGVAAGAGDVGKTTLGS